MTEQERMDRIRACFEFDTKLRCRFLDDEGQSYSDGYYCALKREDVDKNGKKWPKYIAPGEFYKIPFWCPLELASPKNWESLQIGIERMRAGWLAEHKELIALREKYHDWTRSEELNKYLSEEKREKDSDD